MSPTNTDNNINPFELKEIILIVKKRYKIIITIIIIGFITTFISNEFSRPFYQKTINIKPSLISAGQSVIILQDIITLMGDNNFDAVSSLMDLDIETLKKIKSLEFSILKDETQDNIFEIKVTVYDSDIIVPVLHGIISFLKNNAFFQHEVILKKEKLTNLLEKIRIESQKLENTNKQLNLYLENPGKFNMAFISPYDIHLTLVNLKRQELIILTDIKQLNEFSILNEPINPTFPSGPNKTKRLLLGCFIAMGIGFFISIFIETWGTTS